MKEWNGQLERLGSYQNEMSGIVGIVNVDGAPVEPRPDAEANRFSGVSRPRRATKARGSTATLASVIRF